MTTAGTDETVRPTREHPPAAALSPPERWLRGILVVMGTAEVLALPFVLMPISWIAAMHASLGLGAWPDAPVAEYLARSASLLYGLLGCFTLVLATDVRRFRPLIRVWALAAIVAGLTLPWIGWQAGLPAYWIVIEGPPGIPLGLTLLALQRYS